MNGGFLVTKIKQLGDRIFEKILSEKNIRCRLTVSPGAYSLCTVAGRWNLNQVTLD